MKNVSLGYTQIFPGRKGKRVVCKELDYVSGGELICAVRPSDVQNIGSELAIKWEDGSESFVLLEDLRRHCPCAGCKGEGDIMGNVSRGPEKVLTAASFQLRRIVWVGGYGVQPYWADGHSSGIFSFDFLRRLIEARK